MSNEEEQENELLALSSILCLDSTSECENTDSDLFSFEKIEIPPPTTTSSVAKQSGFVYRGQIKVNIELHEAKTIEEPMKKKDRVELKYLPPLYLDFEFPPDYPSVSAPSFVLHAVWLSKNLNTQLCTLLNEVWTENCGSAILFLWTQTLTDCVPSLVPENLDLSHLAQQTAPIETANHNSNQISSLTDNKRRTNMTRTSVEERKPIDSLKSPTACKRSRQSSFSKKYGTPGRRTSATKFGYSAQQLYRILVEYNDFARQREFQKGWFNCEVCFEEKSGSECIQFFPCLHVFCKDCARGYFEMNVKEGTVRQLNCLASKCESSATPQQVRETLRDETLYERYETLLLSQTLDLMNDIVPCPRPSCQQPVILTERETRNDDVSSENDSNILPMATCVACHFSFCTYCRKGFHGIERCSFSNNDRKKLVNEYQSADSDTKMLMDRRYGRDRLAKLIDESLAEDWIKEKSQPCPRCRVPIEKRDGCNKMWCSKCGAFFCWICMKVLNKENPYSHFNSPKSECFNLLFQGVEVNNEDLDWEMNEFIVEGWSSESDDE